MVSYENVGRSKSLQSTHIQALEVKPLNQSIIEKAMARSRSITDEQILEAARAVFLEDGFSASTLEIARRAGISEASIFKRFSTKENLFLQLLASLQHLIGLTVSKHYQVKVISKKI